MASRVPPPKRKRVAYGMAKKAEAGGRLSDKDVERQRKRLLASEKKKKNKKKKSSVY
jgi:hypothetical protein